MSVLTAQALAPDADHPADTGSPSDADVRRRFVAMSPQHLKRLLYGELQTAEDLADLELVATATGVDTSLLIPATGEPDHDPRTGVLNPRAVALTSDDDAVEEADADGDVDFETVFDEFRSVVDEPRLEAGDDGGDDDAVEDAVSGVRVAVAREVLARRYAQATAVTGDLVEAVLRGRRGLAAWARRLLDREGLVVARMPRPAAAIAGVAR